MEEDETYDGGCIHKQTPVARRVRGLAALMIAAWPSR